MMDGLGLAETTPGPLILVTEFVGFIAGYKEGGFGLALIAAALTLWVTFVPCFLWIFTGAPYLKWITDQPKLSKALSSITAAVVGVILNLSVWFALHVLFNWCCAGAIFRLTSGQTKEPRKSSNKVESSSLSTRVRQSSCRVATLVRRRIFTFSFKHLQDARRNTICSVWRYIVGRTFSTPTQFV